MATVMSLSFISCYAQIKNAKTETVKIYGNCGMCEKTIEKAGNIKNVSNVDWNKDTSMATLTYDAKQTNQDEILKRIALVGYDSEQFLAPNDVYNNLHGCCKYDRNPLSTKGMKMADQSKMPMDSTDHATHKMPMNAQESNQLKAVFDNYFSVKDALVQTNGDITSEKSTTLLTALNAIEMDKLPMDVHTVWMKVQTDLKEEAKQMADSKDASRQRDQFVALSENMYKLMKISKQEIPIYYQHCPMANGGKGANWLSKENTITNPYYGSKMLGCGANLETIK
ncbi:DUF3347 domain-containing protein [Pedobacter changchengzhani]|uniref:DUF3347 domain-containing protein n=2 Tax=Pedobacter changchengzhani TaxID=2529274 RepID=A0A4R5MHD4_9SPHI|nr:DUF3347 domain-containing protein [Pedobacter changchengzhani]